MTQKCTNHTWSPLEGDCGHYICSCGVIGRREGTRIQEYSDGGVRFLAEQRQDADHELYTMSVNARSARRKSLAGEGLISTDDVSRESGSTVTWW